MTDFTAILNAEVAAGQPAFASVARRLRDNLLATAEGDATVPQAERFTPGSFKSPTNATQTQELGHQGDSQALTTADGTKRFFLATIYVPGVYTFAGTRSSAANNTTEIYVNDASVATPGDAAFTYEMTLAAGDRVRVDVSRTGAGTITLTDYRLLTEFVVPTAQCQFYKF